MLFLRRPSSSLAHLPLTQILLSQGCHQVQADPKELLPEDAEPGLQGHPASMILGAPSLSPRLHCKEPLLPGRLWLPSQPYLAPSSLGLSFPKDTPGADASGPAGLGFLPREGRGSSGASSLQELYPPSTWSPTEPWPRSEMKGCWGRRRDRQLRGCGCRARRLLGSGWSFAGCGAPPCALGTTCWMEGGGWTSTEWVAAGTWAAGA